MPSSFSGLLTGIKLLDIAGTPEELPMWSDARYDLFFGLFFDISGHFLQYLLVGWFGRSWVLRALEGTLPRALHRCGVLQSGSLSVIRPRIADMRCPRTSRVLQCSILATFRVSRRKRELTVLLVGTEWIIWHRLRKFCELQEIILLAAVRPWYRPMALMDCSLLHGVL